MWDDRYNTGEYVYGTQANDFLRENLGFLKRGQVLSLAEGEGRNATFLASEGWNVTAVDSSAVGLMKARQLALRSGVAIATITADLADFNPGKECYEAVVSIFCHLPGTVRRAIYGRLSQALVPGGTLLLEAYSPEQPDFASGGPKDPDMLPSLERLQQDLPGFSWTLAQQTERDVHEGILHTGRASVIQLLGTRTD